jgi:cell wall-associated NlpC family hydrolase
MRFSLFWFFFILLFPLPGEADFAHTVQPGESSFRIAKRFQVTVSQLQGANGLRDEKIYAGQHLVIPGAPPKAEIQRSGKESGPPGAWQRPDPDPDVPETRIVKEELGAGREKAGVEDTAGRVEWGWDAMQGKGSSLAGQDRQLLVRVARGFVGLKYSRGGNSPTGLDCSAFVQRFFRTLGIDLPRTAREQFQVGYRVAREAL